MNDLKKQLGQKIKLVRKSKNMTQEQLAEIVDIGVPNISYIENGKFAPSIDTLQKIANALKVEPHELYKFTDIKSTEEIKDELFKALEADSKLLRIVYQIFLALRFHI